MKKQKYVYSQMMPHPGYEKFIQQVVVFDTKEAHDQFFREYILLELAGNIDQSSVLYREWGATILIKFYNMGFGGSEYLINSVNTGGLLHAPGLVHPSIEVAEFRAKQWIEENVV